MPDGPSLGKIPAPADEEIFRPGVTFSAPAEVYLKPRAMDQTDQQLIQEYLRTGSDAAFETIVKRYAPLVYGAALRITKRRDLAEDVAQMVFTIFTRKAVSLVEHPILAAWLHKTATLEANKLMRKERTHQRKLREFAQQWQPQSPSASRDHLDEALATLNPGDRQFLLLRFYQGLQVQEIAPLLGKSQAAARKQSERALARLRQALCQRGAKVSSAALVTFLSSTLVKTSHAGLIPTIVQGAAAGSTSLSTTTLSINTLLTMTYGKQMTMTAVAMALLAAIPIGLQMRSIGKLRRQLAERADHEPHPSAPTSLLPSVGNSPKPAPGEDSPGNVLGEALVGEFEELADGSLIKEAVKVMIKGPNGLEMTTMPADFDVSSFLHGYRERRRAAWIKAETETFRRRLGLSEEQTADLARLFEEHELSSNDAFERLFGKGSQTNESFQADLAGILTEEQQVLYEQFQQEQLANRIESEAYQRLGKLQSEVTLTNEQKDAAFEALHQVVANNLDAPSVLEDPTATIDKHKETIDALRPILTPEQLDLYKQGGVSTASDATHIITKDATESKAMEPTPSSPSQ